jgi:hypothetical protein
MALPPPIKPKGGDKASRTLSKVVELSVFDVLNIFCRRWFLSRTALLTHVISAQKAEDGNISWVEFDPPFHSHLVKCAVVLVPHLGCPVPMVKWVMFVFILELLHQEGHLAFFDLQKGGRKANNAQKEKRRLARKRSRAAKREQEWEAAKVAKLPPHERSCLGCGCKFNSRKTAKKHKCSDSKVVRTKEAAVEGTSLRLAPPTKPIKPAAPIPPCAPPAPVQRVQSCIRMSFPEPRNAGPSRPAVTDLQGPPSERTPEEKLWDWKTRAQQYARDRRSCDDTRISYLEFLESEAEEDLALARMIAG